MHGTFGELASLLDYVLQADSSSPKALCRLGPVSPELARRIQPLVLPDIMGFELVVDSYSLRHALTGHSQERGSRDRYPLLEADIIALSDWLPAPAVVLAGNAPKNALQPPRVRFEQPAAAESWKAVAVLEVRTGRRQLMLVTLYKTENG